MRCRGCLLEGFPLCSQWAPKKQGVWWGPLKSVTKMHHPFLSRTWVYHQMCCFSSISPTHWWVSSCARLFRGTRAQSWAIHLLPCYCSLWPPELFSSLAAGTNKDARFSQFRGASTLCLPPCRRPAALSHALKLLSWILFFCSDSWFVFSSFSALAYW